VLDKQSFIDSQLELLTDGIRVWDDVGARILKDLRYEELLGWHLNGEQIVLYVSSGSEQVGHMILRNARLPGVVGLLQRCFEPILRCKQAALATNVGKFAFSTKASKPSVWGRQIFKSGWLKKRRVKFPNLHQYRYFILCQEESGHHLLHYYLTEPSITASSAACQGKIEVGQLTMHEPLTPVQLRFSAFQTNKNRWQHFELIADTRTERDSWMVNISSLSKNLHTSEIQS